MDRLVIVGSGAMACLFGAILAEHTHVTLLGTWAEGVASLRREGIQLLTDGPTQHFAVEVVSDPQELPPSPFALVLVKSWQTERAGRHLRQFLDTEGVALTLQNGLGNLEILSEELGEERALQGVTTYGANLAAPGTVRAGGEGVIQFGRHPRAEVFERLFERAGLASEIVENVASLVWTKLAVNAGINPLTALLDIRNGAVLELPSAQAVLGRAVEEVKAVASSIGVALTAEDPVELTLEVAERTAANRSSMLQDLARGAPTEIDAICGAVHRVGRESGLESPVNWTLWRLVEAAAAGGGHR